MTLRQAAENIPALGKVLEQMQIMSAPGRRMLLGMPFLTGRADIERELDHTGELIAEGATTGGADRLTRLRRALMELKEVRGTITRLADGASLDDVELFELKAFAMTAVTLRKVLLDGAIRCVDVPDLEEVVDVLDPGHARIPHFYIYDAYDARLADVRARLKALDAEGKTDTPEREEFFIRSQELEDEVRATLSARLRPRAADLKEALDDAARLDVLQARAALAEGYGLCRPRVADGDTSYRGLFNPAVREVLRAEGKDFQPVDIRITDGPTVITGANMAGKSVLLKTVALAQTMCQYGFHVAAEEATVAPVDGVALCIGDEQSEFSGLSSFASEMLRIDEVLRRLRSGVRALVLIDEPARTTNPVEGRALVDSLLRLLARFRSPALVATHYSGLTAPCRRLRVRGFVADRVSGSLNVGDISRYIDYSLIEESGDVVPHEAVRIARLLGVDEELLAGAENCLTS